MADSERIEERCRRRRYFALALEEQGDVSPRLEISNDVFFSSGNDNLFSFSLGMILLILFVV